jgi:cytochrome c oxidase assembly protein subunit 15
VVVSPELNLNIHHMRDGAQDQMAGSGFADRLLHWFAVLVAASVLVLICSGGLVTSHEAGMAVPDWPNSFGYSMFLFPVSRWVGGVFF